MNIIIYNWLQQSWNRYRRCPRPQQNPEYAIVWSSSSSPSVTEMLPNVIRNRGQILNISGGHGDVIIAIRDHSNILNVSCGFVDTIIVTCSHGNVIHSLLRKRHVAITIVSLGYVKIINITVFVTKA